MKCEHPGCTDDAIGVFKFVAGLINLKAPTYKYCAKHGIYPMVKVGELE